MWGEKCVNAADCSWSTLGALLLGALWHSRGHRYKPMPTASVKCHNCSEPLANCGIFAVKFNNPWKRNGINDIALTLLYPFHLKMNQLWPVINHISRHVDNGWLKRRTWKAPYHKLLPWTPAHFLCVSITHLKPWKTIELRVLCLLIICRSPCDICMFNWIVRGR